ncbi:hypothetical protein V494_03222 [Pseudogymnoascus sp. VKM F-4513 (FW-928)]|nr:hypothetical protein V494_03222 [Pseudogymnoascus sp. VKM F-4513 (FW-928)]
MSNLTPQMARRHRHNQSADVSSSSEAPRNPQNPHFYNNQVHADTSRSSTNYGQPTTPPRTPQKAPNGKSDKTPGANMGPGSSAKPKSRGNNRAKNAAVTPAAARAKPIQNAGHQHQSVSKPISTPNAAAYAGPTFHASPAPSALPMPSFFSKSVPESPSIKVSDSRADESNASSSDSSPPPIIKARIAEQRQKESPLDFFFNADREEKARARSANSAVGPFQPPAGPPPNEYRTPAANTQGRNNPKFAGGSASSMFAMELDGTPGKPYGPAFSTPYSERINAARSTPSLVNSPSASATEQQKTTDRSEALKSFLFSGQKQAQPAQANGRAPEPPYGGQQSPTPNRTAVQPSSPSGPRTNSYSSPQQQRHNGFPYMNDMPGYGSVGRNTPRSSGLRQEVTPTKTPPERMDGSVFQNSPSYNSKENSASRRNVAGSNLAFNQAPPPNAVASPPVPTPSNINNTDIRTMEDSLRRMLKLEPSGVGDPGIPVAPSPHY